MTLTWYPRGRWPSPCAGCGKNIPAASRRAHDPATNQFYHPACAPSPDPDNGRAKPPRSGPRTVEIQSKAGDFPCGRRSGTDPRYTSNTRCTSGKSQSSGGSMERIR